MRVRVEGPAVARGPSLGSGFRLRAPVALLLTPAKRLKFDSGPRLQTKQCHNVGCPILLARLWREGGHDAAVEIESEWTGRKPERMGRRVSILATLSPKTGDKAGASTDV